MKGMSITVTRYPEHLEDRHFNAVSTLVDPADGQPVRALTRPAFGFWAVTERHTVWIDPEPKPFIVGSSAGFYDDISARAGHLHDHTSRREGTMFRLDRSKTILLLTLGNCQKLSGIQVSGQLLAHEQVHWDIFFIVARATARAIGAMSEATEATLRRKADSAVTARLMDGSSNNGLLSVNDSIQAAYESETVHGANMAAQILWQAQVTAALAAPTSDQLGRFSL